MEVLQIERVVNHLVNSAGDVLLGTHLEFDDEDNALEDDDRIDALTHAWDRKFQR
jgi:hypothetical protein